INTDASGRAIGAVLWQTDKNGEKQIVSTASRVLTPTEQRYSVAEQELLAIVYALDKFRIYVFGHTIHLNTDNKALSFLNKCALTSNRIARWTMQIQEYDLKIKHISGASNFLADTISRNPAGLSESAVKELSGPRGMMVALDFGIDSTVGRKLRDLAVYQANDPKISKIMRAVKEPQAPTDRRYLVRRDILYSKDSANYPYWRPVLPTELEVPVIEFVHASFGHLGTEKCMAQVANTFHVKSLGRKVRKLISSCDICQRVRHPNRRYAIETRSHMPANTGDLCAVDIFGPLPVGRGGVRYILVCLDVFSKFVKLYPLRA
ncbi:hypothetical protein L798_14128, partial [Zootermopsis nevadensis]